MPKIIRKKDTIIDYAKTFTIEMKKQPLNNLDFAILSKLSYFNLGFILKVKKKPVHLKDCNDPKYLKIVLDRIAFEENDLELFKAVCNSKRFQNIIIKNVSEFSSKSKEAQFSATTFILENKEYVISYRGTDSSLNGWKENFNMAFLNDIPSQELALSYFYKMVRFNFHKFYLVGHSKGGNLASYTFYNMNKIYKKKIKKVINFDGPGVNKNIKTRLNFNILYPNKIVKFIPHDAIIGVLFDDYKDTLIVDASSSYLHQHSLYRRNVNLVKKDFEFVKEVNPKTYDLTLTISDYLLKTKKEDLGIFIDTIFELLEEFNFTSSVEIMDNKKSVLKNLYKGYKVLDVKRKEIVKKVVKELVPKIIKDLL